jgi:hypothetical protein
MASPEEALRMLTRRCDVLSGRKSLYLLGEEKIAPEEALCTHWKRRWPHRKNLSVTTGKSDGLIERSSL